MRLIEVPAPDFDLAMTLDSGQVFHWQRVGDGFVGTIGKRALYLQQRGESLKVRDGEAPSPARELRVLPGIIRHYFALDHPLGEICASFPDDPVMNAARDFCRGLRIIRQPKWECLATFICSSMKQVAHIRQISLGLRKRFGEQRRIAISSCTHSLRRDELHKLPRGNYANANWVIAPKICTRRRGSSALAKRISKRGRRLQTLSFENNCARYPEWGRRSQTA